MKISKITSLIFSFLFLLSCNTQEQIANLQTQLNELNNAHIASIDSQIENIKASITNMSVLERELQSFIQQLDNSDKSQSEEIKAMKVSLNQIEQALSKRIDELRAYVDNGTLKERDWIKATFSTLEQYQMTCNELAIIRQTLANMQENFSQSINTAISDSEESLRSWVNNKLTAYYTIAEVDAKLELLKSSIEDGDIALEEEYQNLKEELAVTKGNIKAAYEKAIKDAITNSEGVLTAKISGEIQVATSTLYSEIDALCNKISGIESRINLIETRLEEIERIINGISSLAYVPSYSDNRCVMWYGRNMDGKMVGDRDTLSFEVSPTGTVAQLLASVDVKFEAQAVYNTIVKSSVEMVELPVLEKYGDGEILTIVVSGENMKDSFFLGDEGASCRVLIKTGNAETISDYIQMRPSAIYYRAYFSSTQISLGVGGTAVPEITMTPSPSPLTFTSSDTNVFTVDKDGVLTGLEEGIASLTMTTISGFSQTVTVEVVPIDLSVDGTANCYVVPCSGHFSFKATVRGNSSYSLAGTPTQAKVLWESYGTSITPKVGDLISQVLFEDGKVVFKTPEVLKNGNAVIAVMDKGGKILWSWHIWMCKDYYPDDSAQIYNNAAGTVMDRNLGATSATPGDVGSLGLLYQWGRKDPFLGSSRIDLNIEAKSTLSWPEPISYSDVYHTISYVEADPATFLYSVEYPTTFITTDDSRGDWFYDPFGVGDYLWTRKRQYSKTIYDPCPVGYRVPEVTVWYKALGNQSGFYAGSVWDKNNHGINFTGESSSLGNSDSIWYPAAGYLRGDNGMRCDDNLNYGSYWTSSPYSTKAFYFSFGSGVYVITKDTNRGERAYARSVRCVKE